MGSSGLELQEQRERVVDCGLQVKTGKRMEMTKGLLVRAVVEELPWSVENPENEQVWKRQSHVSSYLVA